MNVILAVFARIPGPYLRHLIIAMVVEFAKPKQLMLALAMCATKVRIPIQALTLIAGYGIIA
jgi:hypothetical protein